MENYPGLYASETEKFKIEYLFFSRTDKRGVIQSGNETFQYISGYEWGDLIGAPHKIVRHPDMPKGVFYLLWDTIQKDQPIGGYVVNRTKDGKPYWVFAVMIPIDDGYLSVRLKPASEMLDKVRPLYEKLRYEEEHGGRSPEESATALVDALKEEGFEDYAHFMSDALATELLAREEKLGRTGGQNIVALQKITEAVGTVEGFGGTVEMLFARTEQIPYNMRLQAGRLEGTDGPISVISDNHRQMSQSLSHSLIGFREAAALGAGPIREAVFMAGVTMVIPEIRSVYLREKERDVEGRKIDLERLSQLEEDFTGKSRAAVSQVTERVREFARICRDMRRMMSGLEMTRIMCKIERSKASGDTEGLDEIVNRLQSSEQDLNKVMTQIEDAVRNILEISDQLMRRKTTDRAA